MARVLVTGASGFIGSHLVARLLLRGDAVRCLVRNPSAVEHLRRHDIELITGDVTDARSLYTAVEQCDTVYHLAGRTHALKRRQFFHTNALGVRNVARACARLSTPPALVVVSSLAAAGPSPDGRPRREADTPRPVSHYGRSKLAGERAAAVYAYAVPISIVRPPIVLGQRDRAGCELFRPIDQFGVHLVPGYRRRRYGLIHAADLVEALLTVADRGERLSPNADPRCRGFYHVAAPQQPTMAELGRWLAHALGRRRLAIVPVPDMLVWAVGAVGELIGQLRGRPVVLGLDKVREATAGNWTCSTRRIREELAFEPAATIGQRLRETADWYRQAGWLAPARKARSAARRRATKRATARPSAIPHQAATQRH